MILFISCNSEGTKYFLNCEKEKSIVRIETAMKKKNKLRKKRIAI